MVVDKAGRILRFNPEAERMLGPGAATLTLLHSDGATPLGGSELPLWRAARGESFDDFVFYARKADGLDGRYLSATARPLPSSDGTAQGAAVIFHDITNHQRHERRIAVQQAVTQILAESSTLAEAAPRITSSICKSAGWDLGAIWRVDREAAVLRCVDIWMSDRVTAQPFGESTRATTFAAGIGLPGRVWKSGEPAWIIDVVADPNFPRAATAERSGLHGAFGFPILLGSEVIGVFEFFSRVPRAPDQEFLAPLAELGAQIGQFIARKRAEEALEAKHQQLMDSEKQLRRQLELTQQQQQAIMELSTPVLEVWDNALALPIIGAVDEQRSLAMTERLLAEVVGRKAQLVIIDVTGVELIDTRTADHLLKMMRAVQLLGARCILTGVRPAVAQTMVALGVDLGSTVSLPSLKYGLRECLKLSLGPR